MFLTFLELLSLLAVPCLVVGIPLYGHYRGIKVFESFVQGAQEGLTTSIKILPYLVAMLVAISLLRAAGALDIMAHFLDPFLVVLGIPAEVIPLALTRPLSGSAAFGITVDLINTYGPDSFIGRFASTMQGSTDTTFYILTVYFGSVGIRKVRHALVVGLIGDLAGFIATLFICRMVFG